MELFEDEHKLQLCLRAMSVLIQKNGGFLEVMNVDIANVEGSLDYQMCNDRVIFTLEKP